MTKLTFLGDIMCTKEMLNIFKDRSKYDFNPLLKDTIKIFEDSDYVFGNLESPVSYNNEDLVEESISFNAPIQFAEYLSKTGINFLATANNHCLDRGISGLESTIKVLDNLGIKHTGTYHKPSEQRSLIINVKGTKLGVMSYTYGTNALLNRNYLGKKERWRVNLFQNQEFSNPVSRWCYTHRGSIIAAVYNRLAEFFCKGQISRPFFEHREKSRHCRELIKRDIKNLKKRGADLILMYMHAGGQYNTEPRPYTLKLTKWLLDNGVSIVVGSHEHVVHGGYYNDVIYNRVATYSLGNFIGVAGVTDEPFDKFAEYSVVWHIYLEKNRIVRHTFSILKTIKEDGMIKVIPCVEILKRSTLNEKEKNKLALDMLHIATTFANREFHISEICDLEEIAVS